MHKFYIIVCRPPSSPHFLWRIFFWIEWHSSFFLGSPCKWTLPQRKKWTVLQVCVLSIHIVSDHIVGVAVCEHVMGPCVGLRRGRSAPHSAPATQISRSPLWTRLLLKGSQHCPPGGGVLQLVQIW